MMKLFSCRTPILPKISPAARTHHAFLEVEKSFIMVSARKKQSLRERTAGFTLLEVLISITILIFISLAIYQSMTQTFRMRDVLIREGDFYNGIRLSMGLVERDLNMLFSPVAYLPPKPKTPQRPGFPGQPGGFGQQPGAQPPTQDELETAAELGKLTDFWLPSTVKTGVRLSRFVGEEQKMSFITSSHQRLYKDRPESEFVKVTYELREEKDEDYRLEGARTLVKIVDTNVFDDEEKKDTWKKAYYILPGVKTMTFRYFRRDKKSWQNKWDNGKTDDDLNGKYPDLVEIKIEVIGGQRLRFDGLYTLHVGTPFYGLEKTY